MGEERVKILCWHLFRLQSIHAKSIDLQVQYEAIELLKTLVREGKLGTCITMGLLPLLVNIEIVRADKSVTLEQSIRQKVKNLTKQIPDFVHLRTHKMRTIENVMLAMAGKKRV